MGTLHEDLTSEEAADLIIENLKELSLIHIWLYRDDQTATGHL